MRNPTRREFTKGMVAVTAFPLEAILGSHANAGQERGNISLDEALEDIEGDNGTMQDYLRQTARKLFGDKLEEYNIDIIYDPDKRLMSDRNEAEYSQDTDQLQKNKQIIMDSVAVTITSGSGNQTISTVYLSRHVFAKQVLIDGRTEVEISPEERLRAELYHEFGHVKTVRKPRKLSGDHGKN